MPIEVHPFQRHFGATMTGIDVRRPQTADEVAAIEAGMDKHAVLVLPGQDIDDQQQLAFTRNFGPLQEGANTTLVARVILWTTAGALVTVALWAHLLGVQAALATT